MKHLSPFEKQALLAPQIIQKLEESVKKGIPADKALKNIFRAHREYGARDKKFFSALTFAFFRWFGWIKNLNKLHQLILAWLLDGLPDYPAIEILKQQSNFPKNAFKGNKYDATPSEKSILLKNLSLPLLEPEQLVPEWVVEELFFPTDITEQDKRKQLMQLITSFQKRVPTWFRIRNGVSEDVIFKKIEEMKVKWKLHPLVKMAICLESENHGFYNVPQQLLKDNSIIIQDLASQCVGIIANPQQGEIWWDVCAGAGGKSLLLADLMEHKGKIVATDIRASALKEFKKRMRAPDKQVIQIYKHNAMRGTPFDILFDGILVDAPCSGVGTWHRAPDARWRITKEVIEQFAENQYKLLLKVSDYVKEGGKIVYSTCTLTGRENTQVVERFLNENKNFRLEEIQHPLTFCKKEKMLYIWPWEGPCNGMFIAVIRRQ